MSTLLLRLAAPLQSWGDASRFTRRQTRSEPTKSGVLGLLAAAQGRRRTDPLEDLAGLVFGVRVDQPGTLVRDFQTARSLDSEKVMPLSLRYYLCDATFLAAVEGDAELLAGLDDAVRSPRFPLYLGRRSCVPAGPVSLGLRDVGAQEALRAEPWQAAEWYRRTCGKVTDLRLVLDVEAGSGREPEDAVRDVPLSFSPVQRQYGWREVVQDVVTIENPDGREGLDFMGALGAG